ncbi:polysaccharide pyruvyl transferase family protein [[Clostridium] spiroforme]|nr:polysaccharide pyruvyl transferase family protein [Thomasclavelia spiroformis]
MKILLIGEWSSDNLGDAVICYCTEYLIKSLNTNITCERADLSCRGSDYEINIIKKIFFHALRYLCRSLKKLNLCKLDNLFINNIEKKYKIKKYLKTKQYDCVIFCGGQLFMDYFYYQVKYYMDEIVNDIPIIFNAIGNGMDENSKLLNEYLSLLNRKNVKYISFRDGWHFISKLITSNKFNKAIFKNYDAALFTKEAYGISQIKRRGVKDIGIGVINIDSTKNEDIINKMILLITNLIHEKYNIHIFTNGDKRDYKIAQQLYSNFDNGNNVFLSICPKNDKELVKLLSKYDFIFSYRLHSHIIAYSLGIPSISITWDRKVYDFFALINRSEYNVPLNVDAKELLYKFKLYCEKEVTNRPQIDIYKKYIYDSFSKYLSVVKK